MTIESFETALFHLIFRNASKSSTSALGQLQPVANWIIVSRRRLLPDAYRPSSWRVANRRILNGCLQQQRSFKLLEKLFCEGQESAYSVEKLQIAEASIFRWIPITWKTRGGSCTRLHQITHTEFSTAVAIPSYQKVANAPEELRFFHRPRKQSFSTE